MRKYFHLLSRQHLISCRSQNIVRKRATIVLEVGGRKFGATDAGAPMLCNSVCESVGRHAHIDYCRAASGTECTGAEIEHLTARITPQPDKPKDAVSHSVFWKRTGTAVCGVVSSRIALLITFSQDSRVRVDDVSHAAD